MKVVYNSCYGGFGLSIKAVERLIELGVKGGKDILELQYTLSRNLKRHDPRLIQVVEELGEGVNGEFANLKIKDIVGNKYIINNTGGLENVQVPENIDWIVV